MKKLLYILLFVPLALFGQDNYSLSFDGVDDYMLISPSDVLNASITNEITLSSWVKIDEFTNSQLYVIGYYPQGLLSSAGNPALGYSMIIQDAKIYFIAGPGNVNVNQFENGSGNTGSTQLSINEWYNISITYNQESIKFYINGILDFQKDIIANFDDYGSGNLFIGSNHYNNYYFDGNIEAVEIWNVALNQEEIQSHITCPPTGDEEGLIGYWNFNESSGDTVYDLSGNGNHGIINGATYSEDVPEQNCNLISGNEVSFEEQLIIEQILDNGFTSGVISNDSYYFVSNFSTTWTNSDSICNSLGGNLLVIETEEENHFILDSLNLSNIHSPGLWIGLSQNLNSSDYSEPYGGWEWVNGVQLTFNENNESWNNYQNWDIGQPNNVHNVGDNVEEYVNIWFESPQGEDGTWNDWTNNTLGSSNGLHFILEVKFGCTDSTATNYNSLATFDDGSCQQSIYGCSDSSYIEFNSEVNVDDGSCDILLSDAYSQLTQENINLYNTIDEATTSLSSLQQALDTWNTTIDLSAGWNMFGYGCPSSINVAEGLSNHTESIIITKDNNGNVYMPEFGFNGIGDFTPGFGYQIKLTEAIEGFSLCDWYVNDIPEDNIVSLQDSIIQLGNIMSDLNQLNILLNDSISDLNETEQFQVGDYAHGGVVFQINDDGSGLVVAQSNLYTDGYGSTYNFFQAVEFASNYVSNDGYNSGWHLPNINELAQIHSALNEAQISDLNLSGQYWSTSDDTGHYYTNYSFYISFPSGEIGSAWNEGAYFSVRPIRSF